MPIDCPTEENKQQTLHYNKNIGAIRSIPKDKVRSSHGKGFAFGKLYTNKHKLPLTPFEQPEVFA
jgi:hypothetical protein